MGSVTMATTTVAAIGIMGIAAAQAERISSSITAMIVPAWTRTMRPVDALPHAGKPTIKAMASVMTITITVAVIGMVVTAAPEK